jgi:K+-sensing histidine kinase KdpD
VDTEDPTRLRESFFKRASIYRPGRFVTVRAEQKQGQVVFRVEDTGKGIPENELQPCLKNFIERLVG